MPPLWEIFEALYDQGFWRINIQLVFREMGSDCNKMMDLDPHYILKIILLTKMKIKIVSLKVGFGSSLYFKNNFVSKNENKKL